MRRISAASLILLIISVSSIYLPMGYRKLFIPDTEKTHLLFSPMTKNFVYREQLIGDIPKEVRSKADDHHSEIAYGDQDGNYYGRLDFERMLPFIYSKNMDMLGLLPIEIDGRSFDIEEIKRGRQVMEMTPEKLREHSTRPSVWPLLETDSGQARLVLPDDVFRMTDDRMEFVNADSNQVDRELTEKFTRALLKEGFSFPARSVNSRVTVLKPFDDGVFIVDHDYDVFHVKRVKGEPFVRKTSIDRDIKTRYVLVSENMRKVYHGLLIGQDGRAWLLGFDDYETIPLPLEGYNPDEMDLKILTDPLYVTATWSDETTIHGLAMDRSYRPVASFDHTMSRAADTRAKKIYRALFPFSLDLGHRRRGNMEISFRLGDRTAVVGIVAALTALLTVGSSIRKRRPKPYEIILVALTGLYGLIAVFLVDPER
ncbi:MAG: DUF4857 domain-containing protein [Synergistota bacterium]|nr:DUF4857 domain-containing protein [Synergistota bacterium]